MARTLNHQPEFEYTDNRVRSVRYLEHGYPNPLVRWHYHEDYELHYIVASSGKLFVGDYIGRFEPGNLVLTGPRLPHNWISHASKHQSYELRDMVIQFRRALVSGMAEVASELEGLLPLLDRARYGIEFKGVEPELAQRYMERVRETEGTARIIVFLEFLQHLATETDYRLLSTVSMRSNADDTALKKVDLITQYATEHFQNPIPLATVATMVGMSETAFSRFFSKATGNGFSEFLSRIRIGKACDLLAHSDKPITTICYETGFNNVANFNRRFRRLKGVTPTEYREEVQQRINRFNPQRSDTRNGAE